MNKTDWVRDFRQGSPVLQEENQFQIPYLTFPILSEIPGIVHGFSTRMGGVSQGDCATMNFSYSRGDKEEAVLENYTRMAKILGTVPEHMVATKQTHTTNVRVVTTEDCGKGVTKPLDYEDVDGLITDVPGICLCAFTADCVPIYFVDPVRKAIGVSHSGWRGTVARMGAVTIAKMQEVYGTNPKDVICAIGPSICRDCYEVSEDVAEAFQRAFCGCEECYKAITAYGQYPMQDGKHTIVEPGKAPGKYQLDLWLANIVVLLQAGVPVEQIQVTDLCTCHNPQYLFSHRASRGKRGNLGAFLMMTQQKD